MLKLIKKGQGEKTTFSPFPKKRFLITTLISGKCGHEGNADFQATLNLFQWGQTLMEAKTERQLISFPRILVTLVQGVVKYNIKR